MKRSKHSLSYSHLTSFDMGWLVPIGLTEVLPGDSIQHSTSMLLRVTPLMAPVMHPVTVRIHHWFVPNRLVWDGWEDFITGGDDGLGGNAGPYPTVTSLPEGWPINSLPDYLGLPAQVGPLTVSALPFRGYSKIWNEWYRDEDLETPRDPDEQQMGAVSWQKDYFTTCRPWPQKGPDVTIPLGGMAPVVPREALNGPAFMGINNGAQRMSFLSGSANVVWNGGNAAGTEEALWQDPNLVADLAQSTSATVDQVRLAFALQRYQEARARFGSRYTEYLRYLGVTPSDARLQLPEYLGGGKQTISFSEVLQTGPGSTAGSPVAGGVGQMAGHGIAGMRTARYRRFFEEHGYVFTLCSVRPKTMYMQGIHKTWLRRTKEDYWQRELEQVGQQEVKVAELYATGTATDSEVFGYQDRYREYKENRNQVSGEFQNVYDYWHYGRKFASKPVLNGPFVTCDPTKRVYQEQTMNELLCLVNHSIQARRMVRKGSSSKVM